MPALINSAEPVAPVLRVRELEDDEEYVMTAFERHASHCSQCADPFRVHQEGRSLCDRGHQYALDVAEYLYSENGKAKSVIDRELSQPTLVKIPRDCVAVRGLLLAIEDGMRLQRKEQEKPQSQNQARVQVVTPVISYDRTFPIAPRQAATQQPAACNEIIEREPRTLKRRRVIIYQSPRGSSRGSLQRRVKDAPNPPSLSVRTLSADSLTPAQIPFFLLVLAFMQGWNAIPSLAFPFEDVSVSSQHSCPQFEDSPGPSTSFVTQTWAPQAVFIESFHSLFPLYQMQANSHCSYFHHPVK
ncbi:hypothetical protein V8F44DRAFT_649592 [Aspergillus fumigatus]